MTRVAIGAIMKQEEPYVLEWVAYHKALGFDLIIADNGGTDNTTKILTALDSAGIIKRIDFRYCTKTPQIPAYRAIIRVAKRLKIDTIGFLDCDEFFARKVPIMAINPDEGARYIEKEFQKFDASQISYYWLIYGSRTEQCDINLPVLERFSYHASIEEQQKKGIKAFKSFIKVNEMFKLSNIFFLGPIILSPHYFHGAMRNWIIDYKRMNVNKYNPGLRIVTHNNGAILHFAIKTWEEFQIKIARGDAIHSSNKYGKTYFDNYDMNDVYQKIDKEVLDTLHLEIEKLKGIVDNFNFGLLKILDYDSLYSRLLSVGLLKYGDNKKFRKFKKFILKIKDFYNQILGKGKKQ